MKRVPFCAMSAINRSLVALEIRKVRFAKSLLAVVFGDDAMAAQILKESDPKKIKACGRKVQNFDDNTWTEKCRDIVREGNRHKVTYCFVSAFCFPRINSDIIY